ncbi:peptidoglycan-binding protein [Romeria aff. gracilis LEGE 07310]|uniref:Peptidoglycan-binding protein n=1 Tax=Vasconcelosia minhoensis LEGE 07310 TaxID=915328 RepID=A0A8J7ABA9_9CYAN|nr:peptidoglycan-binding domain-containing protein [Romeria gracilis]MBE9079765.1 peptidoglycan-binding protein [Romeria aff. gracilis LEGE 07310]
MLARSETLTYPAAPTDQIAQATSYPTLQLGSLGERVSELQSMLTLLSFYSGEVDGVYSESTQAAVVQFQTAAGLEANGVVGPDTWEKLLPTPGSIADTPDMPAEEPAMESANADDAASLEASSELPDLDQPAPASPAPEPNPAAASDPSSGDPAPSAAPAEPPAISQAPEDGGAEAAPVDQPESADEPAEQASPEPAASPAESTEISLPVLRKGMEGSAVSSLQSRLQTLGFYGGEIDGAFGEMTEIAVQNLQREYELGVDGVVGPATWSVLLR